MIYLDHHATTPVDARVLDAMLPFFTERFGNASSKQHRFGWDAHDAVERARKQVAALIGASAKEIVFTSGATEANNLAIRGVAEACRAKGDLSAEASAKADHVVTVTTEHKAVLDPVRRLERDGWRVTVLPVDADGLVDVKDVAAAVSERTVLVSVMAANNEIGVLQPLKEIAAIAHAKGALVHTDAVQAVGKVPFDVEALDVDFASITAHKFYGPKGVGALYVRRPSTALRAGPSTSLRAGNRRKVGLLPLFDGGGQERGMRPGTLNVPGIVGFGAAADIAREELATDAQHLEALRDRLLEGLQSRVDGMTVNGTMRARVPGNLNVSFDGVDGEALLVSLDDIAVSSGAACTQAEPSHVLVALGLAKDRALASLRFGVGRTNTVDEIDYAVRKVSDVVLRLRQMSPV